MRKELKGMADEFATQLRILGSKEIYWFKSNTFYNSNDKNT